MDKVPESWDKTKVLEYPKLPAILNALSSQKATCGFFPELSSLEAKLFLQHQPIGTYLIRLSTSNPFCFVLEYVSSAKEITSILLESHLEGIQLEIKNQKYLFPDIFALIKMWSSILRTPFSSEVYNLEGWWGDVDGNKAEAILQNKPKGTYLIRFSSQNGYAISYTSKSGLVAKTSIHYNSEDNNYYLEDSDNVPYSNFNEVLEIGVEMGTLSSPIKKTHIYN